MRESAAGARTAQGGVCGRCSHRRRGRACIWQSARVAAAGTACASLTIRRTHGAWAAERRVGNEAHREATH